MAEGISGHDPETGAPFHRLPDPHPVDHVAVKIAVLNAFGLAFSRNISPGGVVDDMLQLLGKDGWVIMRAEDV